MPSISGMTNGTFFAGSPVVINVTGLQWPPSSPFNVIFVEVTDNDGNIFGKFHADTGGQTSHEFDISSALQAMWAEEDFADEVDGANSVAGGTTDSNKQRGFRTYKINVYTECINTDGMFERTTKETLYGGSCCIGGMTEWERSVIGDGGNKQATAVTGSTVFGNASTKPGSPEHVGSGSITSKVTIDSENTNSTFYGVSSGHAPTVLRDSQPYVDFLFLNRRGAVETCSGLTKEAMDIAVETKKYGRVERPSFAPSRTVMAIGGDGRRSWNMSSGYVTREWAEWWATEFLAGKRKRWWMRYPLYSTDGRYVPVIVEPAKKQTDIYDRAKQNMPHVDFTVTLALEG